MTTAVRGEIMHIADGSQCSGGCPSCCGGGDRFWYQYLDRALGFTDEPHSVCEIRDEAVDAGAPASIVAMLDGLIRTLRKCDCRTEICWCDTGAQTADPWSKPYSQDDIEFVNDCLISMAVTMHNEPDYALSFTDRPGVGNVCWCGQSVSVADTEALEAHSYCSPEQ